MILDWCVRPRVSGCMYVQHVHHCLDPQAAATAAAAPVATHTDVTNTTTTTTEAVITYSPASPDSDADDQEDQVDEEEDDQAEQNVPDGDLGSQHEENGTHTSRTSLSLSASGSPPSERHSTAEAAYEDMLADFGEAQAPRAEMEDAEFDLSPMSQISQLQMMVEMHTAQLDEEQERIDEERERLVAQQQGRPYDPELEVERPANPVPRTPSPDHQYDNIEGDRPDIESDLEAENPPSESESEPEPEPKVGFVKPTEARYEPQADRSPSPEEPPKRSSMAIGHKITGYDYARSPEGPPPRTIKPVCGTCQHQS